MAIVMFGNFVAVIAAIRLLGIPGVEVGAGHVQPPPKPPRHLYLTSPFAGAVYSFPLTNGIPAKKPDAVITGLSNPIGVGVDSAGYLYVSDIGTRVIDVFAPGSNGPAKPVRQEAVYARYLVVWRDYIIAENSADGIDVYSADGNGPTLPLEPIRFPSYDQGLAVRPDGRLYLTWGSVGKLTVYRSALPPPSEAHEPVHPLLPSQIFWVPGWSGFGPGLAVDEREIYANLALRGPLQIGVFPIDSNGPIKGPKRTIVSRQCHFRANAQSYSLALYANYLYVGCVSHQAVYIYDKRDSGPSTPLFTLHGPFPDVFQIVLGP